MMLGAPQARCSRQFLCALLALALATGCEDKQAPTAAVHAPSTVASSAELMVDAGLLGDPIDPPAPPGDLKLELESFVNVDTCVAERAKLDPLVGDALGAIGYETFLRDACRLLEAAKDKKRETCDRVDSSALRARCQSWVAMVSQTPDACPMQFEGVITRGRNASCVAIAAKDPRLCTGESRTVQRGTCEAMVWRDAARCDQLLPHHRPLCKREVTRWQGILAAPLEGLEKLPVPRGKLSIRGVAGTPDPPATEVDLSADFARGIVVVTARERMRIELGTIVESEAVRIAASPQKRPRVGLAVIFEPEKKTAHPFLQKLEVELPNEATLVSPPATCDCTITTARASDQRGKEAAIVLEGTLSSGPRSYKVSIDLLTYVRDVLSEQPGSRVLPPIHPAIHSTPLPARGLRPDGG